MQIQKFAPRLKTEFHSRRTRNPRYSLRAFAAFLGVDHSTLSQVIRGKRPVPVASIRAWCKKLGLDREETLAYIAAEQMQGLRTAARQHHLKHWTAEAMAILSQPVHWKMLCLCRMPDFHADSRHVAAALGVTTDEVNLALSRFLRLRLLNVSPSGTWSDATGVSNLTEDSFRKLALARVREHATDTTVAERPFRAA